MSTASRASRSCIAQGPAASQIAIKQLGTNGGGFFNVNSAHPFENPTPLTNFIEVLAILLIPAACVYMFGKMVKDRRQGLAVLGAMLVLFVAGLAVTLWSEGSASAAMESAGMASTAPNLEGKEQRLGSGRVGTVGDRHDRGEQWLGQLDARLVQPRRRSCADVQHGDR